MSATLTFLGAVGTVTGSKYLLTRQGKRVLIDCGLFQGFKQLRLRNWAPFPVSPASIDDVLLTHAHIDHTGYVPLLVRNGYRGRILCTDSTRALCGLLLPDSGHLQEKDADFVNRKGVSKHHPALPLYTERDAKRALKHFQSAKFHQDIAVAGGFTARFSYAGHILGAATIRLTSEDGSIVFSGDLGRPKDLTMVPPEPVTDADYLVVESTYGDRSHNGQDPETALADIISRTAAHGGTVLIPAFAVGRTQQLLILLHRLRQAHRIPELPVFLDSPMAIDASDIFCEHPKDHKLSSREVREAFAAARYVGSSEESKELDRNRVPKVIVSASGMATGGRVLHHLTTYAPDPRNTILFSGFQAGGTRGAAMVGGASTVKIFGQYIPVRAHIEMLPMLSAHADAEETMAWLRQFKTPPKMTFVTHGEPAAADALRHRISEELGWACSVPEYRDEAVLA